MKMIPPNSEKSLLRSCLFLLQAYENSGLVRHFDRLNSGAMPVGQGRARRFIRMCRKGTSDLIVVLANGHTLWIELKKNGNGQTSMQKEFQKKITGPCCHSYHVVQEVGEIATLIDRLMTEKYANVTM